MKQSSVFYLTTVENILIKWVITIGTLYATVNVHLNVMNFIHHVIITAIKYCTFKKRKESKVFNTGFKTMFFDLREATTWLDTSSLAWYYWEGTSYSMTHSTHSRWSASSQRCQVSLASGDTRSFILPTGCKIITNKQSVQR